ncbi:MAG: hypothetical protein ACK41C_13330 [Phenylobacterium sp.]|uniref:hypothetical protein n=1 Tax=Phenylobacterium sp. TaxID=1871053 RepID=UPI00391DE265
MGLNIWAGLAAALVIFGPQVAAAEAAPGLAEIERRGAALYAYDQAGWVVSDLAVEQPEHLRRQFRGWVVEPDGDLLKVTFYGVKGRKPHALFIGHVRGSEVLSSSVVEESGGGDVLSPLALRLIRARDAAVRHGLSGYCAPAQFNPVMLPPESSDGTIFVYFLTPQTKLNVYPAGGHYRYDVNAAGRVVSRRAFTRSCIDLSVDGPPPLPDGKPVAAAVAHLLDPHPTEIHVFLSLWMKMPVLVIIPDKGVWQVDGARISQEQIAPSPEEASAPLPADQAPDEH